MALNKYKGFVAGDVLPAENVQSIDPENIDPQVAGFLTGGSNPSAISVFEALGAGDNDGAFKINIDQVEHDNIEVDLSTIIENNKDIAQENDDNPSYVYGANWLGQSFTTLTRNFLNKVVLTLNKVNSPVGNFNVSIYLADGDDKPTGSVLKTVSIVASTITAKADYDFTFDLELDSNTKYVIVASCPDTDFTNRTLWYVKSGNPYAGGISMASANSGSSWSTSPTSDMHFQCYLSSTYENLASLLQTAIRAVTSSTELVTFDTDHFVITSSTAGWLGNVLKLMAPTSGTDISGAGGVAYLDCADNATETAGTGEDFNLVRLKENGVLPDEVLSGVDGSGLTNISKINWTDQNVGIYNLGLSAMVLYFIDFCFSSDKTSFYIISNSSASYVLSRYTQDTNGKYYFANSVTVTGTAQAGCGVTFYNNNVYVIISDAGTQKVKRFDSDLTNETTITISGGSNNEVVGLANNGNRFFTLNKTNTSGGYYDLSGTTLTRGGNILDITGTYATNATYVKTLASTNDKLIFSYNSSAYADNITAVTGIITATSGQTGGTGTINTVVGNTDRWIYGLIPYGDGDIATEFVIVSMTNNPLTTDGTIFDAFRFSRISKSKLGI